MYSKGRRGNPFHDRLGRFCSSKDMSGGAVTEENGVRTSFYERDGRYYQSREEKLNGKWRKQSCDSEIPEENYVESVERKEDSDRYLAEYGKCRFFEDYNGIRTLDDIFEKKHGKDALKEVRIKAEKRFEKEKSVKKDIDEAVWSGGDMPFYDDDEKTEIKMQYLYERFGDTKENAKARYGETYSVKLGNENVVLRNTKMLIDGNGNAYYRGIAEDGRVRTLSQEAYDRRKTAPWHTDPEYRGRRNGNLLWLADHPDSVYNDRGLIMGLKSIQYMADTGEPHEERHRRLQELSKKYGIDMTTLREMLGSEFE